MSYMINGMVEGLRMNLKIKRRIMIIIIEIILILALGSIVFSIQQKNTFAECHDNLSKELENIYTQLQYRNYERDYASESFDKIYYSKTETLAFSLKGKNEITSKDLEEYRDLCNVRNILIVSSNGRVLSKACDTKADFRAYRYSTLFNCFDSQKVVMPFTVNYRDGDSLRYYAEAIDSNRMIVMETSSDWYGRIFKEYSEWGGLLDGVSVGNAGAVMVIDERNDTIMYHTNDSWVGENVFDLGASPESIDGGYFGWITLGQDTFYAGVLYTGTAYIACMLPRQEVREDVLIVTAVIMICFAIILSIMTAFAIMLIEDKDREFNYWTSKKQLIGFNVTLFQKLVILVLIGIIIIVMVSDYAMTITSLTKFSIANANKIESVKNTFDINKEKEKDYQSFSDSETVIKCKLVKNILESQEEYSRDFLDKLATTLNIKGIDIFNINGKVIASSYDNVGYTLPKDKNETEDSYILYSYEMRELLNKPDCLVSDIMQGNDYSEIQYGAISLYDRDKGIVGIARIVEYAYAKASFLTRTDIRVQLDSVVTDRDTICVAINKNDLSILYHPVYDYTGRNVSVLGLDESNLRNGFSGYLSILNVKHYANIAEFGNYYVIIATPMDSLMGNKFDMTLKTGVMSLVFILVMLSVLCMMKVEGADASDNAEIGILPDYHETLDRWSFRKIKWAEQTVEQRLFTMISDVMTLVSLTTTICVILIGQNKGRESIIRYVLSGNWDKGINIFSITAVLIAINVAGVLSGVLRRVFTMLLGSLTPRGITIVRMLRSATKYVVGCILIFYILRLFGVNPGTLLVSAGAVSVVVGLGANTLMADILAGIFLIFEGEFRVGDIVTIDDWRGEVLDIGIRTTKIMDDVNNVKIISNSKVTGIINMTKEKSYAIVRLGIDYGESLQRVEAIFDKEFPIIRDKLPDIIKGPVNTHVDEMGDNAVILRIIAECKENKRIQLERDLRRELLLMFERNNINVPYPQITINQQIDYKNRKTDN